MTVAKTVHKNKDWAPLESGMQSTAAGLELTKRSSKEEYRAQLEAEPKSLRGDTAKGSSSRTRLVSESAVFRCEDNGGGTVKI